MGMRAMPNEMQCGSGEGTLTETRGDGGNAAHCGAGGGG